MYCNYSRDKFDNQISFIIPTWLNLNPGEYSKDYSNGKPVIVGDGYYYDLSDGDNDEIDTALFIHSLLNAEKNYFGLLSMGWQPQHARQVLPNALKTEVVMTGFESDWVQFFKLRCAPNAHPDMQYLAGVLKGIMHL